MPPVRAHGRATLWHSMSKTTGNSWLHAFLPPIILDTNDGRRIAELDAIGDWTTPSGMSGVPALYDRRRRRWISVFEQRDPNQHNDVGWIATARGARTGLFSADTDWLYVAVRKHESELAEVRVYTPQQ